MNTILLMPLLIQGPSPNTSLKKGITALCTSKLANQSMPKVSPVLVLLFGCELSITEVEGHSRAYCHPRLLSCRQAFVTASREAARNNAAQGDAEAG